MPGCEPIGPGTRGARAPACRRFVCALIGLGLPMLMSAVLPAPDALAQSRVVHEGVPVFATGSNVAWINYASDVGPGNTNFNQFAAYFDDLKANGGNSMRLWLHTNGTVTPQFGSDNMVTGPGAGTISDLRRIVDLAWDRRITLKLCLWAFDMTWTQLGMQHAERSRFLLTDTSALGSYIENALIPMVAALREHPGVLAWEVFNEPEGMSEEFGWDGYLPVPMRAIQRFINRVAGAIHRTDPTAKVTSGAVGFFSLANVPGLVPSASGPAVPGVMPEAERRAIEESFAERYGFRQPVERIMAGPSSGFFNYYSDAELIAAGADPDGTLDFYSVHYYSWAGTDGSPFHHGKSQWNLDKAVVVAEFFAEDAFGVSQADLYRNLIDNGYAGAMTWQWINSTQRNRTKALMSDLHASHAGEIEFDQVSGKIFSFTASAAVVDTGGPVTLFWRTGLGSTVTLNGVAVPSDHDTVVTVGSTTEFTLEADGETTERLTVRVEVIVSDGDAGGSVLPARFALEQNYPNPFNPSTTLSYQLPVRAFVSLKVFDLLGREVAELVSDYRPAGRHEVAWNAGGSASGVYFCRMEAGQFRSTRRLLLVR